MKGKLQACGYCTRVTAPSSPAAFDNVFRCSKQTLNADSMCDGFAFPLTRKGKAAI